MKMIVAVIRPERLVDVENELRAVLDEGDNFRITVDTIDGHGRQEGQVELFRGQEVQQRTVPKTRITICVNDAYVERALGAIQKGAHTGAVGDGKIFVTPLEEVVRIRTGERGSMAI